MHTRPDVPWVSQRARAGARPIGLDLSEGQLSHARRLLAQAGVRVPLVQASAEAVPLAAASFDIVFCDHGAMNFADPYRTVPEVARLLRPSGLFAFCHLSPIADLCRPDAADRAGDRLVRDYFGMHRIDAVDEVVFQLPYGEWIRLFRWRLRRVQRLGVDNRSWSADRSNDLTTILGDGSRDPRGSAGSRSAFPCLYRSGEEAEPTPRDADGWW